MNTPEYKAAYDACSRLVDERGFWGPVIENPGVLRFFWRCMMEKHQYNPPASVVKLLL